MKKIMVCALAACALAFTSCDQAKKTTGTEGTETVETTDLTTALKEAVEKKDAASIEAAIKAAQQKIAELEASGKIDEAKAALKEVQTWLEANTETVKGIVGDNAIVSGIIDKVTTLNLDSIKIPAAITDAATKVEEGKTAVEDAKDAVENAKENTKAAIEETKENTKAAAENVKSSVEDAAKEAKDAAQEAKDKLNAAKDLLKK